MTRITIPTDVREAIEAGATVLVSHSAGKDSQAMMALLTDAVPHDQLVVVHAELAGVDHHGLREHIAATVPAGIEVIYCASERTLLGDVARRHARRPDAPCWPSPQFRSCTSDLKRTPIEKVVRMLHRERGITHVVQAIGLRAEESAGRARQPAVKVNKRLSKAGRTVLDWLPIHDMLVGDVFATIADAGQEPHPVYAEGATRLSCVLCIMASKADLRTGARLRPELFAEYVALERSTGWTMHPSGVDLETLTGITASVDVALPVAA